ncbi:MAG: 30S ribosomal protein S8 [Candidatus Zambryskibacteria bacterium CG_4_9_14_3_um_filter_40_16]|uniref:Small ribosomal subunit protein uS8 n=2 Tax=Candidatus Zambryskiibacteriota TaxID=1817925 RepID=A0A2H0K679_9BACT|nr:MAG: 30S ribosomal protein S8 [Candidatus Zambryskibacteria bacterium CG11_big_fil_rev_8_21_14_0_20_40_24]PJA33732.1 MAG: 30S ribosomal protein S8 [Candidatus Zambryskibacteria bacterium CG_4_9_14_3_um_filter_40_16]
MTDPIADMITRIKNAGESRKDSLTLPYSKLKMEIGSVLEKQGYVKSATKKGKKTKIIEIELLYQNDLPRIQNVKRVSKPSRRIYKKSTEIRQVKNGYGSLILTTPKGIKTGIEARKEHLGGEALFEIW